MIGGLKKCYILKLLIHDYADCIYPIQMAYVNQNKFDINQVTKSVSF